MENKIIICNNKFDIYKYIYQFLTNKYDKNIIDNFDYFEYNNNKYIKVKKSNIHIEFTPYSSAIDKTIITEFIYSFCSSLNNLFYKQKNKKIVIIYQFYLLNTMNQLSILYIYHKFKNYCNFIFISNTIDNIITPFLDYFKFEKLDIPDIIEQKWINIYKYHSIKYKQNWKSIIDDIFSSLLIKHNNVFFIQKNRNQISLLFVSNINIEESFLYLFSLFIKHFIHDISKINYICQLFCKYQYSIVTSTRYIIHFETLLIQIYNFLHFS